MAAYVSRPYDDRAAVARMSDMMRDAGAIEAAGRQQRGQGWANQMQRMGDLAADAFQQYGVLKEREAAKQKEAEVAAEQERIKDALKQSIDPATGRLDFKKAATLIGQIDPVKAQEYWTKADAEARQRTEREADETAKVADGLSTILQAVNADEAAGPGALQETPVVYRAVRKKLIDQGLIKPDELPEEYDAGVVQEKAIKAMSAQELYKTLWAAPNAPKLTRVGKDDLIVDESGKIVVDNRQPKGQVVETVDARGNPVRRFVTEDELARGVPSYHPPREGRSGGRDGENPNTLRDDMRTAEQWKERRLSETEAAFNQRYNYAAPETEKNNAAAIAWLNAEKQRIQASYETQLGMSPRGPGAQMRDLFVTPEPGGRSGPFGAGSANAAPANAGPRVLPNGKVRVTIAGTIMEFNNTQEFEKYLEQAARMK